MSDVKSVSLHTAGVKLNPKKVNWSLLRPPKSQPTVKPRQHETGRRACGADQVINAERIEVSLRVQAGSRVGAARLVFNADAGVVLAAAICRVFWMRGDEIVPAEGTITRAWHQIRARSRTDSLRSKAVAEFTAKQIGALKDAVGPLDYFGLMPKQDEDGIAGTGA
jgi:hypothetical protein